MGQIESKIKDKILTAFSPTFFDIKNDSDKHQGHAGHDGTGESHFRLTIVSAAFTDKSRVERYRMVHEVLDAEHQTVHSIALQLKTPDEYQPKV